MQHLKFIHKLHSILSRPELQEWIFWSKQDSSVFVVKPYDPKFSSQVLKKYFKHGNVSSFVRQLHMYGFHKISSNHNRDNVAIVNKADIKWSFTHPSGYFHKNAYSLTLNNIQRKRTGLGKDGKRKNILSPVSVNFINPTNPQQQLPNGALNVNPIGRNVIRPNIPTVGGYLMTPGQSIENNETQQQHRQQLMNSQRVIINNTNPSGYITTEENITGVNNSTGIPGPIYIVDSYPNVGNPSGLQMTGNNPTMEINENRSLNYQRQPVARNPVLTNSQVVSYSPTLQIEQPSSFRHYYQPPSYNADLQQPRQTGVTIAPPYLNHPKNGGLPQGSNHIKPLMRYNSGADHHVYETGSNISGKKRESISISDINNLNIERTSESPLMPFQNLKRIPSTSMTYSLNDKPTDISIIPPSSTDTNEPTAPPPRLPLAEMEEYHTYRKECDEKLKKIDTDMEVVIKSIIEIKDGVNLLSQLDLNNPEKEKISTSDITEEKGNLPKFPEELPTTSVPITVEKLDRLGDFLHDMNLVFNKHGDLFE
ncbi:similar to Saccharomyces cerevisiae YGR249W MGA1 Protein similar to heat shock transcription factor [Maudiozyma saulgeensis]|uniref:Similar to Saccharomyces cerevisiae YGR249W MGA1 Protein similar to heat shock transcription factor n=1 Tax=Maudiozyma saulgeensis TaxID=1789683 RepID=A0A1X7R9V3_9SACH|nr:similar to Saccharomyces cerevisiae YGR249W MGA1 Protein similar to heat shock transcription factor [Kazachstania saulgeensis]